MDPRQQQPNQPQAPVTYPEQPVVGSQSSVAAPPDPQFIPPVPVVTTEAPVSTTPATPRKSHRKVVGIWLLVSPTALLIVTVLLYALINFVTASSASNDSSDLFSSQPAITKIANVVFFLLGTVGFLAWLPCLIIGIVLLATQKK